VPAPYSVVDHPDAAEDKLNLLAESSAAMHNRLLAAMHDIEELLRRDPQSGRRPDASDRNWWRIEDDGWTIAYYYSIYELHNLVVVDDVIRLAPEE
jgi:hypothetical protein